ncbi:hypothetical protein ACMFMF_003727 [Clarireedia jacksonii]
MTEHAGKAIETSTKVTMSSFPASSTTHSPPQTPATRIRQTTTANPHDWESRKQIIYQFYAYHHFEKMFLIFTATSISTPAYNSTSPSSPSPSPLPTTLDLLNMTDADLQFLWRTADMTKGLSTHYKLAEYLLTIQAEISNGARLPGDTQIATHREYLLYKVREYNRGQPVRARFYLRGLGDQDWEFLKRLNAADGGTGNLERVTSGCEVGVEIEEGGNTEREEGVSREIERCLTERLKSMEELRSTGSGV